MILTGILMVKCYQCANEWEYKRQERRIHICYNCQNSFRTQTVRGRVYVYLLECLDSTIYTGITKNLSKRISQHASGIGAIYTRDRGVKRLLAYKPFKSRGEPLKEESRVKGLSHSQKTVLSKIWSRETGKMGD